MNKVSFLNVLLVASYAAAVYFLSHDMLLIAGLFGLPILLFSAKKKACGHETLVQKGWLYYPWLITSCSVCGRDSLD
jgi:hypothetical protein